MVKRRVFIFVFFSLAILYRILWSAFFFDFMTTDEAYYGYWTKLVIEKKDFPIMTYGRHFYVPIEVVFSWIPYILLKSLGFADDKAVFLSLRIIGIIFSFLSSLSLFAFLRIWVNERVALFVSMFPGVPFLDWTVQARGYGVFFLPVLTFLFLWKRRYLLSGFTFGISLWLVPPVLYFLPALFIVFVLTKPKFRDTIIFILSVLVGGFNLILYNVCNFKEYQLISRFHLTSIPTIDDLILHVYGYLEGWIHYQCGVEPFSLNINKFSVLLDIISFSFTSYLDIITLLPYGLVFFLAILFALLFERVVSIIFLFSAVFIYLMSPQDRNMIFILIPFLVILGIGLGKIADRFTVWGKIFPLVPAVHFVFSAFINTKDCTGYYMNFKDGVATQVKNFSCVGKDDSEFFKLRDFLKQKGINMVFSDFVIAPIINAYFYPELFASPSLYIDIDWMPEITEFIYSMKSSGKDRIAFVISKESLKKVHVFSSLDDILSEKGIKYKKDMVGNLIVYYDFYPSIFPDDIWSREENSLRRCFSHPLPFERYFFRCLKKVF